MTESDPPDDARRRVRRWPFGLGAVVLVVAMGATVGWARYTVAVGGTQWRVDAPGMAEVLDADADRILLGGREHLQIHDRQSGEITATFTAKADSLEATSPTRIRTWTATVLVPDGVLLVDNDTGEVQKLSDDGQLQWSHLEPFVETDETFSRAYTLGLDRDSASLAMLDCVPGAFESQCLAVGIDIATGDVRWQHEVGTWATGSDRRQGYITDSSVFAAPVDSPEQGTDPEARTWQIFDIADGAAVGEPFTAIAPPRSVGSSTVVNAGDCEFRLFEDGSERELTGDLPAQEFNQCVMGDPHEPGVDGDVSAVAAVIRAADVEDDGDDADTQEGATQDDAAPAESLASVFTLNLETAQVHQLDIEATYNEDFGGLSDMGLRFNTAAGAVVWRQDERFEVYDARTGELGWSTEQDLQRNPNAPTVGPDFSFRGDTVPWLLDSLGGADDSDWQNVVRDHQGTEVARFISGRAGWPMSFPDGAFVHLVDEELVLVEVE